MANYRHVQISIIKIAINNIKTIKQIYNAKVTPEQKPLTQLIYA
jgi:hypothetical protein